MEKGFEPCLICGDDPRSDNAGKPLCVQLPVPDDCPRSPFKTEKTKATRTVKQKVSVGVQLGQ